MNRQYERTQGSLVAPMASFSKMTHIFPQHSLPLISTPLTRHGTELVLRPPRGDSSNAGLKGGVQCKQREEWLHQSNSVLH